MNYHATARRLGVVSLLTVFAIWSSGEWVNAQPSAARPHITGVISHMQFTAGSAVDTTMQNLAKTFEQTHPGTTVNLTILPYDQYNPKITLLMASGSPPDVLELPNDVLSMVQQGKFISLDKQILKDSVLGNTKKSRVWANNMMKFDGKHIYAAQNGSLCSMQLYYNRDLFKKAKVAYPSDKWTWDDFRAAAKKLTIRKGGKTVQWGADLGYLWGWDGGWQAMAAANGAKIMKTNFNPKKLFLNDPAIVKSWQFMQDLMYKDKVAPDPAEATALAQAGSLSSPFPSGKVGMVPDGCWQLETYKKAVNLGMAPLPKGTKGHVNPVWYAGGFLIPSASHNQALAWEWLRWLAVDKQANQMMASSGLNCGAPIVKAYDKQFSAAWKSVPGGKACVTSLKHAQYFPIYGANMQKIFDTIINPNWTKFQHGKITAKQLSTLLNKDVNSALQSGS